MSRHVLLIEDEPNIIEAIRFLLSRDGWRVDTHADGTDAVQVIQRLSPDLVVLDVMLPGKSGMDILSDLRQIPELRALPVLMLGGLESITGAIIGGLMIGLLEKLFEIYWGQPLLGGNTETWFAFVLALFVLLFRPQGLFGERIIERV